MLEELRKRRVALVHDYLVQDGGAERVLLALQRMFPEAPIYVLIHNPYATHERLKDCDIRTSFLQNLPFSKSHYQWTLPWMPIAIEHFDLSEFDLVISSSSSFAKGIITPPHTTHVCYCHTPTRFLWQERVNYVHDLPQPRLFRPFLLPLLHSIRKWDRLAADRPDHIITNSETSRARIKSYYGRDSKIVSPPVEISLIPFSNKPGKYWLAGGRLVPYKKIDLVVKAFSKLNMPLKVFGTGPEENKLRRMAGKRTEILGHVSDHERANLYRDAIGYICPQEEDFGITMVEAMAAGRPVLTFGKGGGSETVIDGVTGIHLEAQSWEDIGDTVIRFDAHLFDPHVIRKHAESFRPSRFIEQMTEAIIYALDH